MSMRAVAREAGVSASTVSRYLRGELRLNSETERRVEAALKTTGHVRRRNKLRSVALVLPELSNPYFSHLAQVFVEASQSRSLRTQIAVSNGSREREQEILDWALASPDVDSAVYVSMSGDEKVLGGVPAHFPLVLLDESLEVAERLQASYVGADHYGGAYQATQYLVSVGHSRIAHLAGPRNLRSARERLNGYREALQDRGIEFDEQLVLSGPYSEAFGAASLPRLRRIKNRPTAVFTASDIAAIGLISAGQHSGVRVPEDLSLIGFDGIPTGAWTSPRLATVVQPYSELAHMALDQIERQWRGEDTQPFNLPMTVAWGESVMPLQSGVV